MGIAKTMDSQFGTQVNYWNIGSLTFNKRENTIHAILYAYVSQQARLAGALPLMTREFTFSTTGKGVAVIDVTGNILEAAYTILTTVKVLTPMTVPMSETTSKETMETPEAPFSSEFYGALEA